MSSTAADSGKKVLAVVGATGAQGGGLIAAALADPDSPFVVRAITRTPDSEAAQALAARGVEVVRADLDDLDSLVQAFAGADAAFCVTNYWEVLDPEREKRQASNLAAAAGAAGVEHVMWSSLEDTRRWYPIGDDQLPTLLDEYKVPHYDTKGEAETYFVEAGVPVTFLMTSFYWENMIYFGLGPSRGEDGQLRLTLPLRDAPLSGIAAADIGANAHRLFVQGAPANVQRVGIAGGHLTGDQMATSLGHALGEPVTYEPVTADMFRSFGFPGAEDLGNMFQFLDLQREYVLANHSVEETRARVPGLTTFDAWLVAYGSRIPLG